MATVQWTLLFGNVAGKVWQTTISSGDTSAPLAVDGAIARQVSVQIVGTISGSTVVVQGSLDATNYATVADANGNAMSYTVIGNLVAVGPSVVRLQVAVSGGSASGLTVNMFVPQQTR